MTNKITTLILVVFLASSCGIQEIKDIQAELQHTQEKLDSVATANDSLNIRLAKLEAYPDTISMMGNDLIWFYNQQLQYNFLKDSNLVKQIWRPRKPANQQGK